MLTVQPDVPELMVSVARSSRTTLPLATMQRSTTCTWLSVDWMAAAGHPASQPAAAKALVPHPFGHTLWKSDAPDAVGLSLHHDLVVQRAGWPALICPTFAGPARPAEYDTGLPVEINGRPHRDWLYALMTLPFNIASRCPAAAHEEGSGWTWPAGAISSAGSSHPGKARHRP